MQEDNSTMKPFDLLPVEIILDVLSFIDPKDVAAILKVSKRLRAIVMASRLIMPFTVNDARKECEHKIPVQSDISTYRASYSQVFNNGSWLSSVISIELWYKKARVYDTTKMIPSLISIFSRFDNLNKVSLMLKGVTCQPEDSMDSSIILNNIHHLEMELEAGRNSDLKPFSSFIRHCPNLTYLSALNSNAVDTDEIIKLIPSLTHIETLNVKQRIPEPRLCIDNLHSLKNLIVYQVPNDNDDILIAPNEDNGNIESSTSPTSIDSSLEFLFYSFGRGPNGFFNQFSNFMNSQNVGAHLKVLLFESDEMFFNEMNFETVFDSCPVLETFMLSSKRSDLVGKMLYYAAGTSNTLTTFAVGPYCPWTMLVKDLFEIRSQDGNFKDDSAIIYGQLTEFSVYLYWYNLREDILPYLVQEGLELEYKIVRDSTIKDKLFDICDEINCLD